jgi:hypothetical protein
MIILHAAHEAENVGKSYTSDKYIKYFISENSVEHIMRRTSMTWMQLAFAQFLEDFCGITGTFYFFNSYGGVGLSAFSTPDTNGPIVSVEMIDEYRSFR